MSNISAAAGARTTPPVSPTSTGDTPLEPSKALPKTASYKPSIGGWLGTATGTLGGALVGASILMTPFAMFCERLPLSRNALMITGFAAGVVGAITGGTLLGKAIFSRNKDNAMVTLEANNNKQHGTATLDYARKQIALFDRNGDGAIQVVNSSGRASQNERSRLEYNDYHQFRTIDAGNIWRAADTDPTDHKVTDLELARLMSRYDADKSGVMTTTEQDAFFTGERLSVSDWR